jgi:hypothetical protein
LAKPDRFNISTIAWNILPIQSSGNIGQQSERLGFSGQAAEKAETFWPPSAVGMPKRGMTLPGTSLQNQKRTGSFGLSAEIANISCQCSQVIRKKIQ